MLFQIILIFEPALAVWSRAFDARPAFFKMQPDVLLEDSLILDFFSAHMAHVGCLAVLHTYVNLHVVLGGKSGNRCVFYLELFFSNIAGYARIMFGTLWTDELPLAGWHMRTLVQFQEIAPGETLAALFALEITFLVRHMVHQPMRA